MPNLYDDRGVLQDIHSVSSLLKMYFRELPNPVKYIPPSPAMSCIFCHQVCTFHLYDKFVEAARSGDDVRLPKLRDVVSQLPPPNYRFFYGIILTSAQSRPWHCEPAAKYRSCKLLAHRPRVLPVIPLLSVRAPNGGALHVTPSRSLQFPAHSDPVTLLSSSPRSS